MKLHILTAIILVLIGRNVAVFADEKPGGQLVKNVKTEEADKLLHENKKIVVLDVRTPEEFADGHIAGAKNVDFYAKDFEKQLDALDKGRPYLVHCAAGGRSANARDLMTQHQFLTIYHLDGGFNAWKEAGKPVEK